MNNCIKKHINIPIYSASTENVLINEYVQGQPIYQQPVMYNQPMTYNQNIMNQQMVYSPNQYQGNVGNEGLQQTPYHGFQMPNMNPFTNM